MQSAPARDDETAALAALHDLEVLDSGPEAEFDALVRAAALVCGVPISLISLIDAERQWFKANLGLPGVTETPRELAFCAHAVLSDELFEVGDAASDTRFADNPLVVGDPSIRFYAGAPIRLGDGSRIGTICVIDRQPRQLDAMQREVLSCLGVVVSRALEGRRATRAVIDAAKATEQAKASQRDAESFGFAILDAINEPIAVVNNDGAITLVNESWRLFASRNSTQPGTPAPCVDIGANYLAVCKACSDGEPDPEPIGMRACTGIQAVLDGRLPRFNLEYSHHSAAEQRWFILSATPLGVGKRGAVIAHTDITARVLAGIDAERASRALQKILDAVPSMIGYWDNQLINRFANRAYQHWFGSKIDSLPGTHISHLLGQELYSANLPFLEAALRGEEQCFERALPRPDGSGAIQTLARYLPDVHDGNVLGFYVLVFDVSELKRAQDELQALNVALQERSALAEAASIAKSQFLANMSHEIRTPMNAVLGMLSLLRRTDLTSQQTDYAGKTESAARALLGLLNEILDFSKVESGKMTLDPHPFRIDELLCDLSVILSSSVGDKRVEVLFDIDPTIPLRMLGDSLRLQQVLTNLAGNAIKFTAAGEVVLSMKMVQRSASELTLDVAVRDTGIGIAREHQAQIFDGFTQAEASTTRRFGGTGLGLAISRQLVALMGGQLEVDSALGQGSCFHFRIALPVLADPIESAPTALALPLHALLVCNNAAARGVLERMARSLGWTVDTVDSCEEAFELLRLWGSAGQACGVVIVDGSLRALDSLAVCRKLREFARPRAFAVVLLTTAHLEMHSKHSPNDAALFDGVLVKPVTTKMLFDAVVHSRAAAPHRMLTPDAIPVRAGRLSGMRLLIVEDNLLNQQVARELLMSEGAEVQVASNGQEAVEVVEQVMPLFDVVLMDLQMPVMDGLTATRRIRLLHGRSALPVVAMTANAMASDREACMAAGMNDHVAKPFDLDDLVRVLCRCTGQAEPSSQTLAPLDASLPARVRETAAAAGVEITAALNRLGGHRETYERMLGRFVKNLATIPDQLRTCVAKNEVLAASHLLHSLNGTAATLGLAALSAVASRAENLLALSASRVVNEMAQSRPQESARSQEIAGAISSVCAAIDALGPELSGLLQAMQVLPSDHQSAKVPTTEVDPEALLRELRRIYEQLGNADMGAIDAMEALQRRPGVAWGKRLQTLANAVETLDFELAQQICLQMLENERA